MENPKPTDLVDIKVIEITPTHVGQRCPVCNGWGTVNHGSKRCEACEGKGYILVPVEKTNTYTIPKRGGEYR